MFKLPAWYSVNTGCCFTFYFFFILPSLFHNYVLLTWFYSQSCERRHIHKIRVHPCFSTPSFICPRETIRWQILVFMDCHIKCHRTSSLKDILLFSLSSESWKSKIKCEQGWFFPRPCFLPGRWCLVPGSSFMCVGILISCYKCTSHIGSESTLTLKTSSSVFETRSFCVALESLGCAYKGGLRLIEIRMPLPPEHWH